jgi:hypothetical protein
MQDLQRAVFDRDEGREEMTGQITFNSETEEGIGIEIIADYYYSPYEGPDYDGGMMVYPGCEASVEIEDYYTVDENTGEIIEHEITGREREELVQKAFEAEDKNEQEE